MVVIWSSTENSEAVRVCCLFIYFTSFVIINVFFPYNYCCCYCSFFDDDDEACMITVDFMTIILLFIGREIDMFKYEYAC